MECSVSSTIEQVASLDGVDDVAGVRESWICLTERSRSHAAMRKLSGRLVVFMIPQGLIRGLFGEAVQLILKDVHTHY